MPNINNPKPVKPFTRMCSDWSTLNPVRLRIQRDCDKKKDTPRNVDPEATENRRKIEDIQADMKEAKELGMTYREYMEKCK